MPATPSTDLTIEQLVELLAEAGELDAGAEVLEAWRMRNPGARDVVRLQAALFNADDPGEVTRREVLGRVHHSALDNLARHGALLEVAAAYRAMIRAQPDDALWRERLARVEAVLAPLPNPDHDARREAIDAMVARGALSEAFGALRELCRDGRDAVLEQRAETLRGMLFEPAHTRPYRALPADEAQVIVGSKFRGLTSPDARASSTPPTPGSSVEPAETLARSAEALRAAIEAGNIERALVHLQPLVQQGPNPKLIRLRDALSRVRAMQSLSEPAGHVGLSATPEPVSQVDRLVRAGRIREARALARSLLVRADSNVAPLLSTRLADLDVVLDGARPTPLPPRERDSSEPLAPGAGALPGLEVAIVREPRSATPPRGSQSPEEVARGNVTAHRRKVVRLGDK